METHSIAAYIMAGFLRGQDEENRFRIARTLFPAEHSDQQVLEACEAIKTYRTESLPWLTISLANQLGEKFLDAYFLEFADWVGADMASEYPEARSYEAVYRLEPLSKEDVDEWLREESLRRQEMFFSTLAA